jgi:hypothetical protein
MFALATFNCPCEAEIDTQAQTVTGVLIKEAQHHSKVYPSSYTKRDTIDGTPFGRAILVIDARDGGFDTLGYFPLK